MVTAKTFIEYFRAEWERTISIHSDTDLLLRISDTLANKSERTEFMLNKEGFLHRVIGKQIIPY